MGFTALSSTGLYTKPAIEHRTGGQLFQEPGVSSWVKGYMCLFFRGGAGYFGEGGVAHF